MCDKNKKSLPSLDSAKGFTLVEMALVLFAIAIMTGGILQGYKMLENARLLREIKNIESFRTATEMFVGAYKQLPGDLQEAHLKLPGCGIVCNTVDAGVFAGDWAVGEPEWPVTNYQYYELDNRKPADDLYGLTGYHAYNAETILFWYELELTGLLSVVTDAGVIGGKDTAVFGEKMPKSNIEGGYWVGYIDGNTINSTISNPTFLTRLGYPSLASSFPQLGTVVIAVSKEHPATYYYNTMGIPSVNAFSTAGILPLKPYQAAQIDRKIDDGLPGSGKVYAYGYQNSCYGEDAPYSYKEGVDSRDCGLIISIYK